MRHARGLTLIELVVVLAIMAIIGAILIPNFLHTTDKARLKSDVQTARVLQNALDLYNAEQSTAMTASTASAVISELSAKGYIDASRVVLQTDLAEWIYDPSKGILLNITPCGLPDSHIRKTVYNQLNDLEQVYIQGGTPIVP